jgi:hypothetical protein
LVCFLTLVGLVALSLEFYSWRSGVRWQPADIDLLLQQDGRFLRALAKIWEDFKYFVQYGAYLLAALAFFIAVTQIKTVARLVRDFIEAAGRTRAMTFLSKSNRIPSFKPQMTHAASTLGMLITIRCACCVGKVSESAAAPIRLSNGELALHPQPASHAVCPITMDLHWYPVHAA